MKTRYKILLSAVTVVVVFFILLVIHSLNKFDDSGAERILRRGYLIKWSRQVEEFQAAKGSLPKSLYEAAWFRYYSPPKVKVQPWVYIGEPNLQALRDPNVFFQEVEYALIVYPKGWYVIELKPGKYWKHRLMIDQDGIIYEVIELKQE
jgi:hypothetical protein